MEELNTIKSIIDLGLTGILLYFLFVLWKDRQDLLKNKDERIDELNDKVLEIVKDNTKVQTELTGAIKENTKATETLTNYVYKTLGK